MARRFLTQKELELAIEEAASEMETFTDKIDAVYIPPDPDELTDEEDIDDNLLHTFGESHQNIPNEIAGTFELIVDNNDMEPEIDSSDDETLAEKKKKWDSRTKDPQWKKRDAPVTQQPVSIEQERIDYLKLQLEEKSPLDIFLMFFDDEVQDLIITFSQKYAADNNRHDFELDRVMLLNFIGIMVLTGYHTLPQQHLYWSNDEDKGLGIVKNCMSRNTFCNIKRNIHLSDNSTLDKNDKFAKVRPLMDIINRKNLQFGVFSFSLSIDEQMVPYYGRHSCKMYIKGKPVRFGFKLWCLCSSTGYMYQFIPYAGASPSKEKSIMGLGGQVVLDLLSVVENSQNHQIFFDNYFSSYKLFAELKKQGYFATGTIRENRTHHCTLVTTKDISKKERGCFDVAHDVRTGITLVKWNDNSVVTVISNHYNTKPICATKRYNRKEKKEISINQPNVIKCYNTHMGGVDLHDNGIANYRIGISGKKWWWPLFINVIDSTIVNSWKLYNLTHTKKMSQLDFKSYIAVRLIKLARPTTSNRNRPTTSNVPNEMRLDNIGHVIVRSENNSRRRCKVCHSTTVFTCQKCQVHLHTHCFQNYHLP